MDSRYLNDPNDPLYYDLATDHLDRKMGRSKRREKILEKRLLHSMKRLRQSTLQCEYSQQQIYNGTRNLEQLLQMRQFVLDKLNNFKAADPSKFQLVVNAKHFKADEVDVRIEDGFVVVTAKHEEHPDEHGFISRSFTRRYKLPDDVEHDTITSSLSRDNVLTIKAPRKMTVPPLLEEGRIVPIEMEQPGIVEEGIRYGLLEENMRPKVNV